MAGWVKIRTDHKTLEAIRLAKVPTDGMFMGDTVWTPSWVKEALDLYNRNEGYAEMPLDLFLKKMNPEKK